MTIYIAPSTGWTVADLPTEPGTVIQYVNVQDSRNIAALDTDGTTWKVLRVNSVQNARLFEMEVRHLLIDLHGALFFEVVNAP
jgi:hypothetical protein